MQGTMNIKIEYLLMRYKLLECKLPLIFTINHCTLRDIFVTIIAIIPMMGIKLKFVFLQCSGCSGCDTGLGTEEICCDSQKRTNRFIFFPKSPDRL